MKSPNSEMRRYSLRKTFNNLFPSMRSPRTRIRHPLILRPSGFGHPSILMAGQGADETGNRVTVNDGYRTRHLWRSLVCSSRVVSSMVFSIGARYVVGLSVC